MIEKKKKRAIITGAPRGIGFAIAERLISDGLDVIATGTSKDASGPEGSIYHQVDMLDDSSVFAFQDFLKNEDVDILVNNAGINKIGEFSNIDINDFDKIIKVNLRAPFMICQAVIPQMKKKNWGRIVNMSSIFGHISKEFRAPYSSSKFGLDGMTVALSAELSQYGILANSVGPGFIDTDMTRNILGEKGIEELRSKVPMKRLGKVDEIASLVSWLVSDQNTYLTGQNILIDGGFSRV
jgi:3-oxoacyl-[acyl-carrier protein] reductase